MKILDDIKLDYSDVLIRPKRSILQSRKDVDLHRTFKFKNGKEWTGIPIAAANMDTTGTLEMGEVLSRFGMITCLSKHISHLNYGDAFEDTNLAISFGMNEDDERQLLTGDGASNLSQFAEHKPFFCLDVANGYSQRFIDFVKDVKCKWPEKIIIAGNVVTSEMTEALLLAGADIIKIGIGPGSVCTTRKVAGVGFPQLSVVMESWRMAGVSQQAMCLKHSVQEQTLLCLVDCLRVTMNVQVMS